MHRPLPQRPSPEFSFNSRAMIQRQILKSFERVFGSSLIPLLQNCTGKAPTRTPPEFAGFVSFEIGKTMKWKRKFYQDICSYTDAASILETRETFQDFHERRPLAKMGHYRMEMC